MDQEKQHEQKHESLESVQDHQKKHGYDRIYKMLLILPAIFLLFTIVYLTNFQRTHGDIILKDVSITGGTAISVFDSTAALSDVEEKLRGEFPDISLRGITDLRTAAQRGFILETQEPLDKIKPALERVLGYTLTQDNSSIEFSQKSISQGFYQQLRLAIVIAFILMAIIVFAIFRKFVPSFAVILSAFADISMTLAVVNLWGITLSLAGVVAFLMLIGYSVDTDILLTTRILKGREGSVNERLFGAFKTGITMTLTSIAAIAISLFITYSASQTLKQMFTILLIGLGFDIFNTWVTNASIIKWYVETKERAR